MATRLAPWMLSYNAVMSTHALYTLLLCSSLHTQDRSVYFRHLLCAVRGVNSFFFHTFSRKVNYCILSAMYTLKRYTECDGFQVYWFLYRKKFSLLTFDSCNERCYSYTQPHAQYVCTHSILSLRTPTLPINLRTCIYI